MDFWNLVSNTKKLKYCNYVCAAVVSVLLFNSCSNAPGSPMSGSFEIQGPPKIQISVEGLPAGKAFLLGNLNGQRYKKDSADVDQKGSFVMESEENYEQGHYIMYLPDQSNFQMLIGPDQIFTMKTVAGNLLESMKVNGSIDNELFFRSMKYEAEIQPEVDALSHQMQGFEKSSAEYMELEEKRSAILNERKEFLDEIFEKYPQTLFTSFKMSGQNPEVRDVRNPDGTINNRLQVYHYRKEFWDNVNFADDRLLYTPVIINKAKRYIKELTVQHQDSIIRSADDLMARVAPYPEYFKFFANWITLQYEPGKTTLMDGEAIYVHMIQNYFTRDKATWADSMTVYGLQQRAGEMAGSLVGKKAPDVSAQDPDGNLQSIYEIQDPYIIVYMFNPKCEHCMEETPKLVNFYKKWKSRGVEVYAIAVDTNDEEWREYIEQHRMEWINVFDPTNRSIYGKYYVDKTPEIYVLNPDRIIIAKNLKVFQLDEVINRDQT